MFNRTTAAVLLILASVSCAGNTEKTETISLKVGRDTYTIEVARTPEARTQGLMGRKSLPEYGGMLFVFERDQAVSFWMKDTTIPLSIAYISSNGTIREIHDLEPLSLKPVQSERAVRYALELNRGAFGRSGAPVGDTIGFPEGFR